MRETFGQKETERVIIRIILNGRRYERERERERERREREIVQEKVRE
jgi:hypothetical protein